MVAFRRLSAASPSPTWHLMGTFCGVLGLGQFLWLVVTRRDAFFEKGTASEGPQHRQRVRPRG